MKKVLKYGEIQEALVEYYRKYGNCAPVGKIIGELDGGTYLKEEEKYCSPDFLRWDGKSGTELLKINEEVAINSLKIKYEKKQKLVGNRYVFLPTTAVMPFLHFAYHKPILWKKNIIEICYAISGEAFLYTEEGKVKIHQGELLFIQGEMLHDIVAEPKSAILGIQLEKRSFEENYRRFMKQDNFLTFWLRNLLTDKQEVYRLALQLEDKIGIQIGMLLNVFNQMNTYFQQSCIACVENLFYMILEQVEVQFCTSNPAQQGKDWIGYAILHDIYEKCGKMTLKELGEKYNYSENHISRIIRKHTGKNYQELIQEVRVNKAKELLKGSNLEMQEIASLIGYASHNHFSKMFRKYTGFSPMEYRKKVMLENE